MLSATLNFLDLSTIKEAVNTAPTDQFKCTINQPTGDFFYDPWEIKPELKGTVWEKVLNSLPVDQGEARIVILKSGTCYFCHADADDRWHLNLQSEQGYLIDISDSTMYPLLTDGIWYHMNAGRLHTAANFGSIDRIQLVVRQLLNRNKLNDPVTAKIVLKIKVADFRYQFDNTISPWLNLANKQGTINNFKCINDEVTFDVERTSLDSLYKIVPNIFEVVL